jgi:hypothetical protein
MPDDQINMPGKGKEKTGDLYQFLQQLRTQDPAHKEPRFLPDWPMVACFSEVLQSSDRLLVVKSRQMMATWICCGYLLYRALKSGPGIHLALSKEERSANELIRRIQFLLENMDSDLVNTEVTFQKGAVVFPELGVRIISLPAAPYAVRGLSPRTVFWDEMAFTPADEEIWASIKPAIDSGGKFIGVSTPNGPSGVFARLVHGEESAFEVLRLHYGEHRERDAKWEKLARAGLSEARWRREQELSFEGAEGRVFDQFEEKIHVLENKYQPENSPESSLYRGIDFGYRFPAVVWLEKNSRDELVVFDSIVGNKWPIDRLIREIRTIDAKYDLNENDFQWTAVDPAGAAKTDFGISPVEHLQAEGFKLVYSASSVAAGIEVVRALLLDATGKTRLFIDRRCNQLVTAFHGYVWSSNAEEPDKDGIHDHPMDALRYLLVNLRRLKNSGMRHSPRVRGLPPPGRISPL